jgi:hypothetical protein
MTSSPNIVESAEAHEAPGDAGPEHEIEGEKHRQWDRERDDQSRAEVPEEDEEDGDDEDGALEQVVADGVQHAGDEVCAVVDRLDGDPLRQRLPNFLETQSETARNLVAVLAHEHEAEAEDDLPFAVRGDDSATDRAVVDDLRDVPHSDGDAVARGHHDLLELARTSHDPDAPYQARLAGLIERASTDVGIVALERAGELLEREASTLELDRVDQDLELTLVTTPRIHLGDSRYRAHLRTDDPLVRGSRVREGPRVVHDEVVENLAEARCDGTELRTRDVWRENGGDEPLRHDLPREVDVCPVFEDHRDL